MNDNLKHRVLLSHNITDLDLINISGKKPIITLQFQFNFGTYPIVQISSSKLPCIQASRTNFWHQKFVILN